MATSRLKAVFCCCRYNNVHYISTSTEWSKSSEMSNYLKRSSTQTNNLLIFKVTFPFLDTPPDLHTSCRQSTHRTSWKPTAPNKKTVAKSCLHLFRFHQSVPDGDRYNQTDPGRVTQDRFHSTKTNPVVKKKIRKPLGKGPAGRRFLVSSQPYAIGRRREACPASSCVKKKTETPRTSVAAAWHGITCHGVIGSRASSSSLLAESVRLLGARVWRSGERIRLIIGK